jgi:hypothetical protein
VWREWPGRLADLPVPQHEPPEARRAADEVLSRPEYDWDEPSESPIESLARWIADRLDDVLPDGSFGVSGGSLPTWVGYAVLALLVLAVAFLLYRVRAGLRANRKAPRAVADVIIEAGEDRRDWASEALAFEEAGQWREGLRCRYRALVSELAARQVIPDLVGRTAGEFVGDVRRSRPAAGRPFRAATDLFEAAWYGGRDGGPEERDAFAALADEVLATVAAGGPGPEAERELVAPS